MLRINLYFLALVLWLSFLFNLERLHFRKIELIDIDRGVYLLILLVAVLGLILPHWRRFSRWSLQLFAAAVFVIVKLVSGRPDAQNQDVYIVLFQFGAVLVTMLLAQQVGQLTADFTDTVRGIIFSDQKAPIYTADQVEPILKREMQLSRRRSRPLTVLVVEPAADSATLTLSETAKEIQQLLARRYSMLSVGRRLTRLLRTTDFILEQRAQGRLVLILPEMSGQEAGSVLQRLDEELKKGLNITSRYGIASFPEEGLTLEELIFRAGKNLSQSLPTVLGQVAQDGNLIGTEEYVWPSKVPSRVDNG